MQNEQTLEQMIREREMSMPPEVMTIISAFDWRRELRMIVMQNQLMIDVGTDLEQSTYLMLLGVVQVNDVLDRLMEVHELEVDKARKVLEEIEIKIFNPLHKKLIENDKEDTESDVVQAQRSTDPEDRDAILAEIEKEPEPLVNPIISNPISSPNTESIADQDVKPSEYTIPVKKPIEMPLTTFTTTGAQVEKEAPYIEGPGVAKPFALNFDDDEPLSPVTRSIETTQGIQEDPIASGLNKTTMMSAPSTQSIPQAPKPVGAPDPYREPIE